MSIQRFDFAFRSPSRSVVRTLSKSIDINPFLCLKQGGKALGAVMGRNILNEVKVELLIRVPDGGGCSQSQSATDRSDQRAVT